MRFRVLASDYDGTLAHDGHTEVPTVAALQRLLDSGRKLILVTGRQLPDLLMIFPEIGLFERVVAENGAILYRHDTREQRLLAPAPPAEFIHRLQQQGIQPAIGHAVVATWRPHETIMYETIRALGLDWHVVLNKDAVMALPCGVSKASGLAAALTDLGCTPEETVGIGDAENDHALLAMCGFGVAVANALPALKAQADHVTAGSHGAGVLELIDGLLSGKLGTGSERKGPHAEREDPNAMPGVEATRPR